MDRKDLDEIRKEARKKAKAQTGEVKKAMPAALKKKAMGKSSPAPRGRVYEVQAGDNLSKIALDLYGDAGRWREILEANQDSIKDPNLIRVGQKLAIP